MSNNLPTTPGPYWWREKDGDVWALTDVQYGIGPYSNTLICYKIEHSATVRPGCLVEKLGGQWAKAHKPDDGRTLTHDETEFIIESLEERHQPAPLDPMGKAWQEGVNDESEKLVKLFRTCEPVTIYRKGKE